ncbi:MAG: putative sulfate exporter family transporter [Xanthobacteraceae bacterium]
MSDQLRSAGQPASPSSLLTRITTLLPGIALCAVVTGLAVTVQSFQERTFGHPYLEAIVIAILLGMAVRSAWTPGARWRAGIAYSAKQLLEVAVALLGASVTFAVIASSGVVLLVAIVTIVVLTLLVSYGISRALGLSTRLAILIACGNSICGNSAIAAVAPVINASSDDIASSISFTAILGVIIVLGLPILVPLLAMSETQYGILAGLTVYAVPQVLAATVPVGLVAVQIGTLVKLVRVMMLGPVVACIALGARRFTRDGEGQAAQLGFFKAVPWFIVAFFVLSACRSFALIPDVAIAPIQKLASLLTVLSMAALGLGVDLRVIGEVGGKVTAAVTLSLVFLVGAGLLLVRFVLPG